MTKMMALRRRALMAAAETGPTNGLVDGSYNNGTVAVSSGNHLSVTNPAIYSQTYLPFQNPIAIRNGDVVGIRFTPKPFATGTSRWYAKMELTGGGSFQFGLITSAPSGNVWYDATSNKNGLLVRIIMEARSAGLSGDFDVSVRVNGEVVF